MEPAVSKGGKGHRSISGPHDHGKSMMTGRDAAHSLQMEEGGQESWGADSLKAEPRQGKGFSARASSKWYQAYDNGSF